MKLHEYQERAISFIEKTDKAILSVGMGLGKTSATLTYIDRHPPATLLIVAPKLVALTVWKQEAEKWGFRELHDAITIVKGTPSQRAAQIKGSHYLVISRDNLEDVRGMKFDLLVIDELTSFKNHASNRSDAICSIFATKIIGLTGTFLTNGAIDMFGQFMAVGLGGGMTKKQRESTFYQWRAKHFKDALQGSGLQFQNWKLITPMEELISKVKDNIFTLSSADWLKIPQVTIIEHLIELSPKEMAGYTQLNAQLFTELGGEVVSFTENQKFAKLQTLCNGFVYIDETTQRGDTSTKLDHVTDFVSRAVAQGEQVFLLYAFKEEKEWLQEKLKKAHVKFTDVKDRNFMTKWESGDVDVLLGHPASCGHGLNLQNGGRICVWSSLTYDYELFAQANARLARQGQKQGVQIHIFMAEGTVEPLKLRALTAKERTADEFTDLTK